MVADSLKVCAHCRHSFKLRATEDICFYAHWVDKYFLVDVLLIVEGYTVMCPLYQEVYMVELVV